MKVARKHGNHKIDSKMPPDLLKELKEFGLKNRWETDLDKVRSIIDAIPRR